MSLDKRGCGLKSTFGVNTGASSKAGARQLGEDRGEEREREDAHNSPV